MTQAYLYDATYGEDYVEDGIYKLVASYTGGYSIVSDTHYIGEIWETLHIPRQGIQEYTRSNWNRIDKTSVTFKSVKAAQKFLQEQGVSIV